MGLLGVGIGADGDDEEVGDHAVGDEGLAAVDDVVVAHVHGAALDVGEVGAEVGLGHAHGHDGLAADYLRQPLLALLLGAVFGNVGGDDVAGEAGEDAVEAALGVFLGLYDRVQEVAGAAGAAVLLVHPHGHEARLAHLLKVGMGDAVIVAPLVVVGDGFLVEKGAEGLSELVVLPLEREFPFHLFSSLSNSAGDHRTCQTLSALGFQSAIIRATSSSL